MIGAADLSACPDAKATSARVSSCCISGTRYANVLPLPVSAASTTSFPARTAGTVIACIIITQTSICAIDSFILYSRYRIQRLAAAGLRSEHNITAGQDCRCCHCLHHSGRIITGHWVVAASTRGGYCITAGQHIRWRQRSDFSRRTAQTRQTRPKRNGPQGFCTLQHLDVGRLREPSCCQRCSDTLV